MAQEIEAFVLKNINRITFVSNLTSRFEIKEFKSIDKD